LFDFLKKWEVLFLLNKNSKSQGLKSTKNIIVTVLEGKRKRSRLR